jgi:two-component system, OmpR family, sensor kinase
MPEDGSTLALPVVPARGRLRRSVLRTLTTRAVLVTCLAALVSVLVTALVAFPLAVRSANGTARVDLAERADLAAGFLATRPRAAGEERVAQALRRQGVDLYLIRDGRADQPGLPPRILNQIAAGDEVSGLARVNGATVMVEGRTLPSGAGNGVVLTRPAVTGVGAAVLSRLWFALLAGLLAGGVAGALLARLMARPIRHAAAAAARLSAGDRSVRVAPEPPAEAEELAHALNGLAAALATSERRQRDFLLSVSHELRTPLTTLKGYAEALSDGVIGPEGAQRAGATMLAEAAHLDRLVADLLALARLEAADFPVSVLAVDLTGLLGDAAEAWGARSAAAGLVLRTELPPVPVVVQTDPGRIRQVVDGLLENALRVVPAGAPLVLAVYPPGLPLSSGRLTADSAALRPLASGSPPDSGRLTADSAALRPLASGFATVEVRDGGPGLRDEDLAVAFERGALSERYRGVRAVGSGLGLALAAGLVRRLGGTIEAGHAAEGGARFTVRLPVNPYQARTGG